MKLTIGRKLYLSFGIVVAMLLLGGALVWNLKLQLGSQVDRGSRHLDGAAALSDAQGALWALRWGSAQYKAATDQAVRQKIASDGPKLRADLEGALQRYDGDHLTSDERALLGGLRRSFERYATGRESWLKLMSEGKDEAAAKLRADALMPLEAATIRAFADLIELQHKVGKADSAAAAAALSRWTSLIVGCAVAAALLACGVAVRLGRSITKPIRSAVQVAQTVAQGDLDSDIDVRGSDETAELLAALKRMNESLGGIVMRVRAGSENIATASQQIAQGNQDLSQRTEEQASALQQTAASMEQLGATVKQNADNARQANQLALGASGVAAEGGTVVAQVVETMRGINDSSSRIADIIGVIDGIAFQTNILALNAAVEAARAGEQGRGFAVVAAEVRSLAQRSADAAKEIKSLITASVEQVEQGSLLVDRAGATMDQIVTSIGRVTDIMGEISAASTEQSTGVAQVGEAISQMDRATQQNAALVEQSAAAAESLREQAQHLVQSVALFRLSDRSVLARAGTSGYAPPAGRAPSYVQDLSDGRLPVHAQEEKAGHAGASVWQGTDRRGPNRATNVTRPAFGVADGAHQQADAHVRSRPGHQLAPGGNPAASPAPTARAKTGTDDDDWTTF